MIDPSLYSGREQTYVKHLVLTRYLEKLVYKVGRWATRFFYVDGFSGPWQHRGEDLQDTSPALALSQLSGVREGLAATGKYPDLCAIFIEKDPAACASLRGFVASRAREVGVTAEVLQGAFEDHVADIQARIREDFGFVFIDPTGWTGYPMEVIAPLLRNDGRAAGQPPNREVLINFMSIYAQRFVGYTESEVNRAQFDALFGDDAWRARIPPKDAPDRERRVVELYCEYLQAAVEFPYVTYTRILVPGTDRSYFYLIYGTHHVKGLTTFREIEEKAIEVQERLQADVRQRRSLAPGQPALFAASENLHAADRSFHLERERQLVLARADLLELLRSGGPRRFEMDLLGLALLRPFVWREDVRTWVREQEEAGRIENLDRRPRQRVPKDEDRLQWVEA